jgi:Stage II sporulation protein E (SpoIIE)
MSSHIQWPTDPRLGTSADPFRLALRYAFYDWTREMPRSKRFVTWIGHVMQGYAVYALWSRSLVWPVIWPKGPILYLFVFLLYVLGGGIMNLMLSSEFVRKTQLESEQIAARQIQRTLQPETIDTLPGYEVETFYRPFRDVGGDYFDVLELPGSRTLFAVADVSGKGMAAALLAANIQALVRSIANVDANPLALAGQINKHLNRYTPSDRFATAVFLVLNRASGELTYVNAGHNPPDSLVCGIGHISGSHWLAPWIV